ncbi:MAG TPA: phosphopantetheine-binding protein [Egibacteraceae bacterium]|nr:phosphopantetheine-binding protein [Egibacteraceae bacterium]
MASAEQVLQVLIGRITKVMGIDAATVTPDTRFDEDLHADSLDRVEIIEGVERDLRRRGEKAAVSDETLIGLRTVGEASVRIAAATVSSGEGRGR